MRIETKTCSFFRRITCELGVYNISQRHETAALANEEDGDHNDCGCDNIYKQIRISNDNVLYKSDLLMILYWKA
jgi:hypothetical protein